MDVGNYTLGHLLGRGGTSEVYAAKHRERGDSVAVKVVQTAAGVDLVAEATRVREIQHPNVVRMIEVGSDAASCYLVMELIEGETLATRLRRGPLAEPELRELGAAIADGMQAAHVRGIVHRDLKPGNVMLRGDAPVIVDFGIAKSLGATSAAVTERRVGTVAYMAPEQLVDGLITPAVDIWALGVTLYEAATGKLPFSSFQDGRLPQLFESAPRLMTTSPAFAEVVARCLDRAPGKRPASMADIARALRADDGDRVTTDIGSTAVARSSNDGVIGSMAAARSSTDGDIGSMAAARSSTDGDIGSMAAARSSTDGVIGSTAARRSSNGDIDSTSDARSSKSRWPIVAAALGAVAIATAVIVTREPTKPPPPPTSLPAASHAGDSPVGGSRAVASPVVDKAVVDKAVVDKAVVDRPVIDKPVVEVPHSPTKRTRPRPKPRTTSQGETLD